MHDFGQTERQTEAGEDLKHLREPLATSASVMQTNASFTSVCGGTSTSSTPFLMRQFLHFLGDCYNHIDTPLDSALQQSVELARFVESTQCQDFLPRQQQQVRWGLWELLRDEKAREVSLLEMEKQVRLYGGSTRLGRKREFGSYVNPSREALGNAVGSSGGLGQGGVVNVVFGSAWHELNEVDEDALLETLRARGRYHVRLPRHASHCQRRIGCRKNSSSSHSSSASQLTSSLPPRPNGSRFMTVMGVMKNNTPQTESSNGSNTFAEVTMTDSDDPCVVLGTVETLTPGCSLCIAQGLIQGCWVSLHLLQLVNVVSTAHLCAAPLLVPNEALSTSPKEALCVGYHVAQQQLKVAVGFLFSVSASTPASIQSTSATQREQTKNSTVDDEKKHHAKVVSVMELLARQGLDVCVHLLAALRLLEPENAYLVLLHAAVLSFCDRNGVRKAKQLLRGFIASSPAFSERKTMEKGDFDMYDMWLQFEAALGGEGVMRSDSERIMLLLEQVVTGILFSVFLELLEMKEQPLVIMRTPYASGDDTIAKKTVESSIAMCLRARDVLDKIVQPRLFKLYDAADGAIGTRARQSQSLCWLLRGTLCHILTALSLAPGTASMFSHTYAADEALACTHEAVKRSDAAREFVGHPLAPAWVEQMLNGSNKGEGRGEATHGGNNAPFLHAEEIGGDTFYEWRLRVEGDAGAANTKKEANESCNVYAHSADDADNNEDNDNGGVDVLPAHERVTDVALLPPAAMRLWFVLAQTLFRSTSADLVIARSRDSDSAEKRDGDTCRESLEASAVPSMCQTSAALASHTGDVASPAPQQKKMKSKKGLAAQRAVMAERENVRKVMEARRLTEQSPLGFWWRWQEAMTHYCLLSVKTDTTQASLLGRYRHLFTSVAGEGATLTTFMRALAITHPILPSESWTFVATHFFPYSLLPSKQTPMREEGSKHAEFSLDIVDVRLREAWQRYELQCVQPAIAATTVPTDEENTRHTTTSSAVQPNDDRPFQQRTKQEVLVKAATLPRPTRGIAQLTNAIAKPTSLQTPSLSQLKTTEEPQRKSFPRQRQQRRL
ncbi:hypothetical protein TCSYLVIO_005127 [Trypanosoma cruzi]|nr:hypothetical protein TCSYLVIO_005127 [Trypanosoma cruzi]